MTTAGHSSQFPNIAARDLLLDVVVAQEDLRGVFDDGEGRALSAKVLWSLQVEGRPLPLISRIFTPSNKNEDKAY